MSVIEELQSAVATVAERAGSGIVGIGRGNRGSGIVIADGKVLTNAHNLRGDEVTVTFADGRRTRGTVSGVDGDGDLAVVDVDTAGATALEWGDGESLARRHGGLRGRGQPRWRDARHVRARLGHGPLVPGPGWAPDQRQHRAHRSPRARLVRWRARSSATGTVVGVNTNRIGEGFYLALPADAALRERIDALGRGESPKPTRLGVAVAPAHVARRMRRAVGLPERAGVLVRGVEDGSLAEAAGIDGGDLIVSAGGKADRRCGRPVRGPRHASSSRSSVVLVRGTEERTVSVG